MAEWRPLHQSVRFRSGLETGGQSYDPPLLPYEKSLIAALDCSEEEYKKFVRYAMQRAHVRPAEYAHIPDIQAILGPAAPAAIGFLATSTAKSATTIVLTNLAIGVALTAASLLLAPKAPSLEDGKIKSKKLADQIGPSRFNQATSFDNAPSLAELNQPIPIPFGSTGIGADGETTGGLILVPALVWSRVYAYGAYQAFEGVYVAGEHSLNVPNKAGILLGTTSLTSLGNADFAFYYSSNPGNNRPATLFFGSEGPGATGTVGRPVFTAPTNNSEAENNQFSKDFSMSYVPSGDTTFGTGTPIHNGTSYRFNWEVVSGPFSATEGSDNFDARQEVIERRRKIAGTLADVIHVRNGEAGMPGVGRAYSRRMGFVEYDGTPYETKTTVAVEAGKIAVFQIDNNDLVWEELEKDEVNGFPESETNLKDLVNEAKSWRQRASDLLVVGSKWIVGASSWIVVDRIEEDNRLNVRMECTAITGVPEIGIPGRKAVQEPLAGYEGDVFNPDKHCGAAYYTLSSLNIATIRPVRRDTEVIELGIRSQVFNRAAGLCNFNALPSPARLYELDKDDVNLTTGRMDRYFQRSSLFSVWVRPVAQFSNEAEYVRMPPVFCVQGSAPLTQNNFLRIRPRNDGYYEYRLIPRTGDDIAINSIRTNTVIVLQSSEGVPYTGSEIGVEASTKYGDFRLTTQGKEVQISEILTNDELFTNPSKTVAESVPTTTPSTIEYKAATSNTGSGQLIRFAWLTHFLGNAKDFPGQEVTYTHEHYKANGDRYVTVQIKATSRLGTEKVHISPNYIRATGSNYYWDVNDYTVISATGDWNVGDGFAIHTQDKVDNSVLSNELSNYAASIGQGYTDVHFTFRVDKTTTLLTEGVKTGDRVFEQASQVADCSHYTQLTKSNESGPEHEIVYVNEYSSNQSPAEYDGMTTIGLALKTTGEISGVEQLRVFTSTGIKVEQLRYRRRVFRGLGLELPSNNFAELVYYLLTNKSQGVGSVVPAELVDESSLEQTADFLANNRIFYDGVLENSESFRSFLYDTAPLQLCTFTIKNGKFGLQPALPFFKIEHDDGVEGGKINAETPVVVEQIFTAGNIIENSLQLQYIDVSQRSNIRALVTWRVSQRNALPTQASALVHWADIGVNDRNTTEQAFDLSEFCTNREQALRTARFLLSVRRRITKTVSFKTVPDALGVQPGSYIRVITEASTYNSSANGSITDAGTLVSITTVKDGDYEALLYNPTTQEVTETTITIADNAVSDSQYHGSLFTLLSGSTDYSVYQIESLNLEEDGLVSISAVEVPTDASGVSIVAKDVLTPGNFTVLE
jgi:hypothetical protein